MPNPDLGGALLLRSRSVLRLTHGPLMADKPPLGVKSQRSCKHVRIFLMLDEGVISSHNPSPNPEHSSPNTFFFLRELWTGEQSLPRDRSLFWPQETEDAWCSLSITSQDGGGTHCSTIIHSGMGTGETWDIGAVPRSGVFVRYGVLATSGVLAFSGVLDRLNILAMSGLGD